MRTFVFYHIHNHYLSLSTEHSKHPSNRDKSAGRAKPLHGVNFAFVDFYWSRQNQKRSDHLFDVVTVCFAKYFEVFVDWPDYFLGFFVNHPRSGQRIRAHHPKCKGHVEFAHTQASDYCALVNCGSVKAIDALPNILVLYGCFMINGHGVN